MKLVSVRSMLFFGLFVALTVGAFLLFPDAIGNEIQAFQEQGLKHWWVGFAIFSLMVAGVTYYFAVYRAAPSVLAFWFLISFVGFFIGLLAFTDAGVAAHAQLHDAFWNAVNNGDISGIIAFLYVPLLIFIGFQAAPFMFWLSNRGLQAAGAPPVLPEQSVKTIRHKNKSKHTRSRKRMQKKLGRT